MNIKQAKEEIKHTVTAYLKKDDEGRYIIPLSKTSVSLKKDTSSKLYTSSWSSSDDTYAKVTNSSYSASAKITHPSYNEGAKVVTLTLKILDKTDGKTVLGTRDYQRNGICRQRVFHNGIYHE